MSVFKNQGYLTIKLDTGLDLTSATNKKILYEKPQSRAHGSWPATAEIGSGGLLSVLTYSFANSDIDVDGTWKFQAYCEFGGKKAFGEYHRELIQKNLE